MMEREALGAKVKAGNEFRTACQLLLVGSLLGGVLLGAQVSEKSGGPDPLTEAEAERLFLNYINDSENLIRSCVFLGGVRIHSLVQEGTAATVRIDYRIQCSLEEFPTPPLSRILREDFLYKHQGGHWTLRGRAVEVSPWQMEEGGKSPSSPPQTPEDPETRARRSLVEQVLSWAALGMPPSGMEEPFPGGEALRDSSVLLVSGENLERVGELQVGALEVHLSSSQSLLRRTTLAGEGVWVRFKEIEVKENLAHAEVHLVTPILPPPPPGETATRTLVRVRVDFARQGEKWVLTRFRER